MACIIESPNPNPFENLDLTEILTIKFLNTMPEWKEGLHYKLERDIPIKNKKCIYCEFIVIDKLIIPFDSKEVSIS